MVHGYILSFYDTGFYRRTGGFLKNGFAVSYARTAGTRKPEYSIVGIDMDMEDAEIDPAEIPEILISAICDFKEVINEAINEYKEIYFEAFEEN